MEWVQEVPRAAMEATAVALALAAVASQQDSTLLRPKAMANQVSSSNPI